MLNKILLYYLSGIFYFLLSILFFYMSMFFMIYKLSYFMEWNVFEMNSMMINMYMYIDWMTLMFMFTVMIISSMIMFYSSEYMLHDLSVNRFVYLLFFFILSMLLMIISPNMISILIGWDGLGLVSYCLVIYYQSYLSYNSGMLTVMMNRIGDVFILISLSIIMMMGSWNFMNMNYLVNMILILVVLASFTKSAQFPFSSWLPAAMAAPTPVSSLVHSSTLVTAGVYLIIRFHYLIFKMDLLLNYILITGLITMLMAGFSACFEYDLKKIIAYSTLSQLGLMMMILGFKDFELAFFHLVVHAMFKSMMFMCSGIIIHFLLSYQDIRYMGIIKSFMPMTSFTFMISNFSLCGMPFFSGFYSKDLILEMMMMGKLNLIQYLLMLFATGLTVTYSIRLSYYLLSKMFNFVPYYNLCDLKIMNIPMFILLIFTIMFGYMMSWLMFSMIEEIYLFMIEKILVLLICIICIYMGYLIYSIKIYFNLNYFLKYFLGKMWFLYNLNFMFVKNFLMFGMVFFKILDKGWMEWFIKKSIMNYSNNLKLVYNLNLNSVMNLLLMMSYLMMIYLLF